MYNPFSLSGKTILITGAASGIGKATALECAKLGATLVLTDVNAEKLNVTFEELKAMGGEYTQYVADLCDESQIEKLIDSLPCLDGCVNNAGVGKLVLTPFLNMQEIERIQKINLIAPMLITKNLVKKRKLKKPSSIVYTASAAGVYRVSVGNAIYATTKCGIDAFMRTTALELAPRGIRCNSVNPGMIETNFAGNVQISQTQMEAEKRNYPLGRFGKAQDVALAIVYLLSDASEWMTGTALKIDGGMTLS